MNVYLVVKKYKKEGGTVFESRVPENDLGEHIKDLNFDVIELVAVIKIPWTPTKRK